MENNKKKGDKSVDDCTILIPSMPKEVASLRYDPLALNVAGTPKEVNCRLNASARTDKLYVAIV